ncbi:MAG: UDP-N-acetylglucosamine--N-acetylmuramyl-(pentapeptide) pyrophosphoryl-undecaprenol N-acetylglucosamine transferase [Verrucomicrobiota bacterium]|jgi:UDP-N-acetylglucosamine--N-acetylmuramyl-(pentapeptide) pyrophosphoryl-undecaprenol N-acetylglucosamine transferase
MTNPAPPALRIAIACGGTGGHLFPGLAVAEQLRQCGGAVTLLISPKEVDQQAVSSAHDLAIVTLPGVGLTRGGQIAFLRGFARSYRAAKAAFKLRPPHAALAMGGFTSAPPLLAAKRLGARIFLHESNSVPGRANRWLSWFVHRAFVSFPSAGQGLRTGSVTVTGTPVRSGFQPREAAACCAALGLDPARPVLLVMGGSQGASGINSLVIKTLPLLAKRSPHWQWFHLTGSAEVETVKGAYAAAGVFALVHPFFAAMELALGAATAALSRAGGSSLAELAAMRLPSVLVPYPAATDDHQLHNARALEATGAARLLEQNSATPETLARLLGDLVENPGVRVPMQQALAQWHRPRAARQIAETILQTIAARTFAPQAEQTDPAAAASVTWALSVLSLLVS